MIPFHEIIDTDWRFEYKYRLTYQQYFSLRSALLINMKKDQYTLISPTRRYFVRSLYFDSYDLKNYVEKVNGDCDRVKLRIRTYTEALSRDTQVRVEMKARKGIAIEKHHTWVEYNQYLHFIGVRHWRDVSDVVLSEFERYVHLKTLRPKVIVEYQREGYLSRGRDDLRVTFDHHVRSASASSLYPQNPFFRKHHPGWIVFEVKCDKSQPNWLWKLVKVHGLRIAANSKYAQGIEITRPELVMPSWSY